MGMFVKVNAETALTFLYYNYIAYNIQSSICKKTTFDEA